MPHHVSANSFVSKLAIKMKQSIVNDQKKKLVFILGAGVGPALSIMHRKKLIKDLHSRQGYTIAPDEACWNYNEYARLRSGNVFPTPDYYAIYRILKNRVSNVIFTTNYDLYLQSMLKRVLPNKKIVKNPICTNQNYNCEELFCHESYLTRKNKIVLWKIHGCIDYVIFKTCHHVFKMPNFYVSSYSSHNRADSRIKLKHVFLWGISRDIDYLGLLGQNCNHHDYSGLPQHYIDFNYNDRRLFESIVTPAVNHLNKCSDSKGVIILGFTGYYNKNNDNDPRNEALVEPILNLATKGVPIMMAIRPGQEKKFLWEELLQLRGDISLTQADLTEILYDACQEANIMTSLDFEQEYNNEWREKFLSEKDMPNLRFEA